MRTLRQLCAAFVLTLTLALSAFAGQIDTTFAPPPPPQQSMTQATTGGEISTTVTVALNLIQSVLSLI